AAGLRLAISAAEVSKVSSSENIPNSRQRRAINWVYWEPKSRITTPFCIMAETLRKSPVRVQRRRTFHPRHFRWHKGRMPTPCQPQNTAWFYLEGISVKFLLTAGLILSASLAYAENESWIGEIEPYIKTLSRPVDVYTWDLRAKLPSREGEALLPNDPR